MKSACQTTFQMMKTCLHLSTVNIFGGCSVKSAWQTTFDALYALGLQYVLLYSNLFDFVTILLQFTLFYRDDMIVAKYALSQAL